MEAVCTFETFTPTYHIVEHNNIKNTNIET